MSMITILEGPDGTGKTSLAKSLVEYHGGRCYYMHAKYRWPHKMHIYHLAILRRALNRHYAGHPVIIDRLWISELIYGAVYRNGDYSADYFHFIDQLCRASKVITVFCLPYDFETHFARFEKLRKERDEMFEMDERYKQLCYAYVNMYNEMKHRPDILRYTIEEHGNELTIGKFKKWLSYINHIYQTNGRLRIRDHDFNNYR